MTALRVLHVAPYYEEAWAYGGIPRVVSALARGTVRRGHRVTVCATDVKDERARLAPEVDGAATGGVDVRLFPNVSNRLAYRLQLYTPRGLGRWLRGAAADFDVAHLHGCHHLPGAVAARALRRAGVPYVLEPNGTGPRHERRLLAKWVFDHTLGSGVMPGAARVLAVSETERRELHALGVEERRLRLLPNPIDEGEYETPPTRGAARARWGVGDAPVVLFLGVLSPRKGADVLLEAFARLATAGSRRDARLVIAGNDGGVLRALIARARQLEVAERVTFPGLLRGGERLEALADADVVAYPSRDEAFGLVPLEALLCGTPVVVGDDHGCGEVIGAVGGGLRVPPGDVEALAGALRAILGDATRWRAEAAGAAPRVRGRFGAHEVCARLEEIYEEVVRIAWERRRIGAGAGGGKPRSYVRSHTGLVPARPVLRALDDFLILVPARDEAPTIRAVLDEVRARWPGRTVLVVDDASGDATAAIAAASGAPCLQLGSHLGVGGALRAGLRWAARQGFQSVVRVDADGQHPAAEIGNLLAPILAGEADAAQGVRGAVDDAGFRRRGAVQLSQRLLAALLSWRSGGPVSDPTSGFWAFGPAAVRLLAEHHPTGYPEPELLLLLDRNRLRRVAVPVRMRARAGGRTSLTWLRTSAACWRVLLATVLVPMRARITGPAS